MRYFDSVQESREYGFEVRGGFWSERPYYVFENTYRYEPEKLLLDQITVVEADHTRTFYNWLQCFSVELMRKELDAEGFEIQEYFANVAGDPYSDDSTEIALAVTMRSAT